MSLHTKYSLSGAIYPLTQPGLLASCIIGSVLGGLDIRELSLEYQEEIVRRFTVDKEPFEQIVRDFHAKLQGKQTKVTTVKVANIYRDTPDALNNVRAFSEAESLAGARNELRKVSLILADVDQY